MGIQINGQTDTITATDGSLSIQGASGNLTGDLTGNVTGNVTGNLTGTASTATAAATAYGLSGSPTLSGIGSVGIGSEAPRSSLDASQKTDAIILPSGTTAQRPGSSINGMIRYNSDTGIVEYFTGSAWYSISETGIIATGGTVTEITVSGVNYKVHTFTDVGVSTFTVSRGGEVEYLVIGGGGGGSRQSAGGGGAGGYRCSVSGESSGRGATAESGLTVTVQSYSVIVGAGGTSYGELSDSGTPSVFSSITSLGGGKGANRALSQTSATGGSGGGGASTSNATYNVGASGTPGQGYDGGTGVDFGNYTAGGGGGAGGNGSNGGGSNGNGGGGVTSSINGSPVARAGGGGGGSNVTTASASAGGGTGGNTSTPAGTTTANTGGGGGSTGGATATSGAPGVVIIRYRV